MKTQLKSGRAVCTRIFALSILIVCIGFAGCTTTETTDTSGNKTTTTAVDNSPATQAAISAGVQIATAAANAAIQTYLTAAPATPRARLSRQNPAIAAAERATEIQINHWLPILSPTTVHRITSKAFAKALNSN